MSRRSRGAMLNDRGRVIVGLIVLLGVAAAGLTIWSQVGALG